MRTIYGKIVPEVEELPLCSACAGSGEGMSDGSTCRTCKGSGVDLDSLEYDDSDEYEANYEGEDE